MESQRASNGDLPISVSQIARITGISHRHSAKFDLNMIKINSWPSLGNKVEVKLGSIA
jgi:hypothetical protein